MDLKMHKWLWLAAQVFLLAAGSTSFAVDRKIYVANEDAGTLSVIDGASLTTVRNIAVGQGAHNV